MKRFFPLSILLIFTACSNQTQTHHYNGEKLTQEKCAACHNLDMPPKTSDTEKAPPLYTVTVHLKEWMAEGANPSDVESKFTSFVKSYVIYPDRDNSYCTKEMLDKYGLMPSQKGNVTEEELDAIAQYIFNRYDQMKLLEIMQEHAKIAAMPPAEQVLAIKDCKMCHVAAGGKIAPTFAQIGKKYQTQGTVPIIKAITHGSKGAWPQYTIPMRAYTDLTPKQLEGIAKYILSKGKKK